ncbi:M12 family metallo-peptidase [Carnobacterium gallinarum]|uniref:M12 family metallo-peptidase n=1 Tax=Carnobacterium gallinarum TaxID=2749 RepID=UPI00054F469E|nr:matrixin family metalloprotease [Carnobacterium gallinarum]
MKKFFSLLFLLLFISLSVYESIGVAVRPWVTFYDGRNRFTNGIGNYGRNTQYYWVSTGIGSATETIDGAMSKWVNSNGTGVYTPISYRRTGTQSSSLIDFQKVPSRADNSSKGTVAWTSFWNGSTQQIPAAHKHWNWAQIELHNRYFSSNSTIQMRAMAHEIGHAFGLDHNPDSTSKLMYPSNISSMPTGPVTSELQGINWLYK